MRACVPLQQERARREHERWVLGGMLEACLRHGPRMTAEGGSSRSAARVTGNASAARVLFPGNRYEDFMKEYVKAVRHDTLRAIENAERLVASLGDGEGPGSVKLRKATKRFARHLKEELSAWDDKYKRARAKA